ncbi:MAG: spondin domain-containing protein [Methylococcaceae bacterium]
METIIKNWRVNSQAVKKQINSISVAVKASIFTFLIILSVPLNAATYKLTFTSFWNGSHNQSNSLPENAHLTVLVGATHQSGQPLWKPNTLASLGVQNVAEQGNTSAIMDEINTAIMSGTAHSEIIADSLSPLPSSSSVTFEVFDSHSNVSFVSMVAPSPDWFIGISDISLKQSGNWVDTLSIDLAPWDAGTKEGADFDFGFVATNPHELISKIIGTPFIGSPVLANLTFERIDSEPPVNNEPVICEIGVDPQVISPNEGTVLWWYTQGGNNLPVLNNGIGQVNEYEGYEWVYPTETTTYKMSVNGRGGQATCETTIVVEGATDPVPPLCALGADPQTIRAGDDVPLWWWFQDSVITANIDNQIGSVGDFQGYQWVQPTETTTYTMTVENGGGTTGTCETTIEVEGETDPTLPICTIGTYHQVLGPNERTTVWWWTSDEFDRIDILPVLGKVENSQGTFPELRFSETTTIRMTVQARGRSGFCETTVVVE